MGEGGVFKRLRRILFLPISFILACPTSHAPSDTCLGTDQAFRSVLAADDLAPPEILWDGRSARISGGATSFPRLVHAVQTSVDGRILRTEIKNTTRDRRAADQPETRRRSEVVLSQRLHNQEQYWMAISIKPASYPRPKSMAETSGVGGTALQIHADNGLSLTCP